MKNMLKLLGIAALTAVIGVSMFSCSNSSNPPILPPSQEELEFQGMLNTLITTPPDDPTLTAFGLTSAQFNEIRDAGGGGFKGWKLSGDVGAYCFEMIWTERTVGNYSAVADKLSVFFGAPTDDGVEGGWYHAEKKVPVPPGTYYNLNFTSANIKEGGMYMPAGAMSATFEKY